ncbi:VOC family protein [Microbacterium horticulturae]|uniref:VOC family protein n=1 Tax=Microbacterium horticulturae TaxID=3028316 RepID=A0ABY8BX43_9MICO|nr:VOC family protein [Microbacterium sp. KACC 23027]WEG08457.1 VOC family protein [Microbacterium sp. KACC 23027]
MHVDHIGLSVGDLDAQRDWYQRAFGFGTAGAFDVPGAGLRGVFLLGPDGISIELLERRGSTHRAPASTPPDELLAQGWGHLCLRVADIDETFAGLVAAGARVVAEPGPSPEPGVRFAYLTDPEGNFIELLDRKGPVTA